MIDNLVIDGEPFAKGRPRFSCIRGKPHVYTDEKTRAAEEAIGWQLRSAMTGPPTQEPVRVQLIFHCKKAKGDLDNLCKTVLDAANGIVFEDDKQVVWLNAEIVRVDRHPCTIIAVSEIKARGEVAA